MFPTTTTTTTTNPTTTATVPARTTVTRTYRDFERLLNKWQNDFDTKHRSSYENLAQAVRQRDIDLATHRETLQNLQRDIQQMRTQQNHFQDELKLLETHEKELETNIVRLENEILQLPPLQEDLYSIQQQNLFFQQTTPMTFNERLKNFQLMEQLDALVKCSTKELQEIVERMNEQDDEHDNDIDLPSTTTTSTNQIDPIAVNEQNIKQLTKTLDSSFKMLTFIDTNVADIEAKVNQLNQRFLNS